MRQGRAEYNVCMRSIRKPMESGGGLLPGFRQFRDAVLPGGKDSLSPATACISGRAGTLQEFTVLFVRTLNELAAAGAVPGTVSVSLLFPLSADEPDLRVMTACFCSLCREYGVSAGQVSARADRMVSAPAAVFSGLGSRRRESDYRPAPGDALLAFGHTGLSGTYLLEENRRSELAAHFAGGFLDQAAAFRNALSLIPYAEILSFPCVYGFPVQEGGVFAALWYLAEGIGCGFEAELRQLPIRQETVELCEFFRLNPYQLSGDGMMLAVTDDADRVLRAAEQAGISCRPVGYLTGERARILKNGEEFRCLDRPALDEWFRMG